MQTATPPLDVDPLSLPDERGHFGPYGGMYVPETLMTPLFELTEAYRDARKDPEFQKELDFHLREFAGRPTNLYFAERLTEHCGGAQIYLKREDLLHTGEEMQDTHSICSDLSAPEKWVSPKFTQCNR